MTPNLLLAGLFKDDELESKMANYLAGVLEKHADKSILA